MKFEVYQDARKEWRWRLRASNNSIIAVPGEGYVRKADCLRGIELVKQSADAPIVEVAE